MSQNLTPGLPGRKMSDSLRERLKRSSRYYSPQAPKRQCAEQEAPVAEPSKLSLNLEVSHNDCQVVRDDTMKYSGNKNEDDSSQDFEYSDDNDKIELYASANPQPVKNLPLNFEEEQEIIHKRSNRNLTRATVSKENTAVPKFKCKRPKSTVQPAVSDTVEETLDTQATDHHEKSEEKTQVPTFDRTPVTIKFRRGDTNSKRSLRRTLSEAIATSTCSSEMKETGTPSVNTIATDTDDYEEEKTETFTCEQLDNMSSAELNVLKQTVLTKLEQKEETLRKLKMVKMYRSKNNLVELAHLISKWRNVCHEALEELLPMLTSSEHQHTASVYQLARYFNLDLKLLQIQPDTDSQEQG